jgi:predicted DNA-binding transcriptional regulator AlpA
MPDAPDLLLCEHETAERLRVPPRTLQKWRRQGRGPDYIRLGPRSFRYEQAAIEAYIAAQRRTPGALQSRPRRKPRR